MQSNVVKLHAKTNKENLDAYCEHICNGLTMRQAYLEAVPGRADSRETQKTARDYHRLHREYITSYVQERIGDKAGLALNVVTTIMLDTNEKGGIRLKAAQDILDRAGYNAKTKLEITTKDIQEMSTEDIKNEIQKLLSEIPTIGVQA